MNLLRAVVLIIAMALASGNVAAQPPIELDPQWLSGEPDVFGTGMTWRDCNNDGYIDVFFSNGNDIVRASNTIYLSNFGELPASATWYSADTEYSGHSAVGDIDDNGYADFVVSNFLGPDGFGDPIRINLYSNFDGLPATGPSWYSAEYVNSFSCSLGDVDGDGDLDLAVATGDQYTAIYTPDLIYYNQEGSFQSSAGWESRVNTSSLDISWGDVDNDGDLDLATCGEPHGALLYINAPDGLRTTPSWQSADANSGNTLIFGDVNGDGWLDLVVAFNNQTGTSGYFEAFINDGAGNLSTTPTWQSATQGYGAAVSMYDYDNDGDDDLAAGRWWDRPRIYENTGTTFTTSPVWQATPSTVVEELAWIDVDGDGVELMADSLSGDGVRKLFYTSHHPLQAVDSVKVDGTVLSLADYCYDMVPGWISLGTAPQDNVVIYYQYSYKNDLTVVNWDTSAEIFGNTNRPLVDFYTDVTVGQAPLDVGFSDSSLGASAWSWDFGNGESSSSAAPVTTYADPGNYDVTLTALLADGYHTRRALRMVTVLADTLYFPEFVSPDGQSLVIPVNLKNTQPLTDLVVPVIFAGELDLDFSHIDTDSCRTDYFEVAEVPGYSPSSSKIAVKLSVSEAGQTGTPLPPGDGPIFRMHLTYNGGMGRNDLDSTSLGARHLFCEAGYANYVPVVRKGFVQIGLCGDIDGNGTVADIGDLVTLVDYFFNGGPAPPIIGTADVDGTPGLSISDVVYLVDYMFQSGPEPNCR